MKKILYITNGHGEDLVAAELIKRLGKKFDATALPLVGEGKTFDPLGVRIIGPKNKLPSGGFSLRNPLYLMQDIYAGLIGNTLEQIGTLKELRGEFDLIVAIGDIVPVIAAMVVKTPFIFVGVNKSDYYKHFGYRYTPWEKLLLQRYARKVFVRDKITETNLKRHGIKVTSAEYVGNPLMDCFDKLPEELSKDQNTKIIGLLPGTRDDARLNLEDFEKIADDLPKLKNHHDVNLKFIVATPLNNVPKNMEKKTFVELLAEADLVIGLSGTANEQAAGVGIPVVSFYGRGSQYNKRFAEAQKQLLGDALSLVRDDEPISVAAEIRQLLRHPAKMKQMSETGKKRMGEPGGTDKIADYIRGCLSEE
jgi:hypothetical protein